MTFGFEQPWALLLLLPLAVYMFRARRRESRGMAFSRAATAARIAGGASRRIARLPDALRAAALVAAIIALAGPRTGVSVVDIETEGIAIALAVDISSSMLAEDFHPRNRLAVAKTTVGDFIRGRRYDRIGLVAFAGEAMTQVPATIDYAVLFRALENLHVGMLDDGTAIGTAIATAANRLRDAPGESRVMVLMTDGENNRGAIDPRTAAEAAAALGIRIYTIGVGSEGVAPMPVGRGAAGYRYANLPVHIDEELLGDVAERTDGRYFRATDEQALDRIYRQIDALERTPVEVRRYVDHTPRYLPFVVLAALMILAEWAIRASRWGRVP